MADDPLARFPEFVGDVLSRMRVGRREYGDRSFSRDPLRLVGEIREEVRDICGWAYVLDERLNRIEQAIRDLPEGRFPADFWSALERCARVVNDVRDGKVKP